MKHLTVTALAMLLLSIAASAVSAPIPPSTALFGSVTTGADVISGHYECLGNIGFRVNSGMVVAVPFASTYIRPTSSSPITLDLGHLQYVQRALSGSGSKIIDEFDGTASLNFSTTTGGKIVWDFPLTAALQPGAKSVPFSAFSQTYDSANHLLTVNLKIDFGACSLPVVGIFHG